MPPKIVLFDIETPNLNADFGHVICFGWKLLGEKKTHCISIRNEKSFQRNNTDDRSILRQISKILGDADLWVGWYSRYFDVPFLDSRLILHEYTPLPPLPHVDCWRIARFKLHIHSNRLKSVSEFLELEEKTPLLPGIWHRAASGHAGSIRYVEEHCIQDVKTLEQAYLRLRPLCHDHPNLAILMEPPAKGEAFKTYCPICGAAGSMVRGRERIAKVGSAQLFRCRKCGGWGRGPQERVEGIFIR